MLSSKYLGCLVFLGALGGAPAYFKPSIVGAGKGGAGKAEPIPANSQALYNQVDGNNDGVLTPAEFAFWSQARGVVAKACQDDEDFKDPLGYSCADWGGYCFTKLLDYASDYTPQDILKIIYNCPKTCDASCQKGSEPEPEPEPEPA